MIEERKARKRANAAFFELGRSYHNAIPVGEIDAILAANGFNELEPAIYCGREGRAGEQVGPNSWFSFYWYKMPVTGRYEIVAYIS